MYAPLRLLEAHHQLTQRTVPPSDFYAILARSAGQLVRSSRLPVLTYFMYARRRLLEAHHQLTKRTVPPSDFYAISLVPLAIWRGQLT